MKLSSIFAVITLALFLGCSTTKMKEEKPMTEKVGQFKHAIIQATATDPKGQEYLPDLSSMMLKRLVKAKLFESVSSQPSTDPKSDIVIKGDIFECVPPPQGFHAVGETMKAKVRFTMTAKSDGRAIGTIQAETDANGKSSWGGFSNTDKGTVFGRSLDTLVKYLKDHA